jgi:hypothetical protein
LRKRPSIERTRPFFPPKGHHTITILQINILCKRHIGISAYRHKRLPQAETGAN